MSGAEPWSDVVASMGGGIAVIGGSRDSAAGELLSINPAGIRILGLIAPLAVGQPVEVFEQAIALGGEPLAHQHPVAIVWRTGQSVSDAIVGLPGPHGSRWLLVDAAPVTDDSGAVMAVAMAFSDITAMIRSRGPRLTDGDPFRVMSDTSAGVVVRGSSDGVIEWVSSGVTPRYGWLPEELIGRPFMDVVDPQDRPAVAVVQADVLRGIERTFEARIKTRAGPYRWTEITVRPVLDESGAVVGRVGGWRDIQAERDALEATELAQRRIRSALDALQEAFFIYEPVRDADGTIVELTIVYLNATAERLVHHEAAELVGRGLIEAFPSVVEHQIFATYVQALETGDPQALRVRDFHDNGAVGSFDLLASPFEGGIAVTARDITELVASEKLFRTAMNSAAIGMTIIEVDGSFRLANQAFCALVGRDLEWLAEHRLEEIVAPEDLPAAIADAEDLLGDRREVTVRRVRLRRADGSMRWTRVASVLIRDGQERSDYFLCQIEDITAEHDAQEELRYRAFHDSLTGLRNRAWILDILDVELRSAQRSGATVGVLFVDLDNFKVVNDSLGHVAGDEVLARVAERIAGSLRPGDRVGRFGGDEFVIVVPAVHHVKDLERLAERVSEELSAPLQIRGHRIIPTASIGIAVSQADSTPESMLRNTDAALLRAKGTGRARWRFFDEGMHTDALARLTIEDELRTAIAQDQLCLYYQPLVDLSTGSRVGYEALVRWNHPTRGVLCPADFLGVAEDTGLVLPIGATVVQRVCQLLTGPNDPGGSVNVNVSAVELADPEWPGRFRGIVNAHGVDPRRLIIEVTETAVLSLAPDTHEELPRMTDFGVGLHVDDFGTGFSSITLLRDLPVTGVKLDGSFVADLSAGRTSANALAAGLCGLVRGLDLTGIAECIETPQQAAILRDQGWHIGQGYLFGKPGPLA